MTTLRLTYEELGARVGRSPEGARMLTRRRRWRVEKGNDGKARVLVDEADLVVRPTGRPPGQPVERPAETDRAEEITALKVALAVAEERVAQLQARLEREQGRADRLEEALRRPWWWRWLER